MTREEIDDVVVAIMINDGPDGHCDGHAVITDFICSLMEGKGVNWVSDYNIQQAEEAAHSALGKDEFLEKHLTKIKELTALYKDIATTKKG